MSKTYWEAGVLGNGEGIQVCVARALMVSTAASNLIYKMQQGPMEF